MRSVIPVSPEVSADQKRMESLYSYLANSARRLDALFGPNPDMTFIDSVGTQVDHYQEGRSLWVSRLDHDNGMRRQYQAGITFKSRASEFTKKLRLIVDLPVEQPEGQDFRVINPNSRPDRIELALSESLDAKRKQGRTGLKTIGDYAATHVIFVGTDGKTQAEASQERLLRVYRKDVTFRFLDLICTESSQEEYRTAPDAEELDKINATSITSRVGHIVRSLEKAPLK